MLITERINWQRITEVMRPNVRIDAKGKWWLHYRVMDEAWTTTPGMTTDFSIVLEAQNEDDALQEASNRLLIPVKHIRRFGS